MLPLKFVGRVPAIRARRVPGLWFKAGPLAVGEGKVQREGPREVPRLQQEGWGTEPALPTRR